MLFVSPSTTALQISPGLSRLDAFVSLNTCTICSTCNTYLQKSGLLGTVFGLLLGMAVIFVITWNLQYMIRKAPGAGGIVIACGMAKYEGGECVADVFNQADRLMYENKNLLKSKGAGAP